MLRYLLCAAGDITTSDVDLAAASGGMVVGFNLSPDENVLSHAKNLGEWGFLCADGVSFVSQSAGIATVGGSWVPVSVLGFIGCCIPSALAVTHVTA